jgi:hypothetical protein
MVLSFIGRANSGKQLQLDVEQLQLGRPLLLLAVLIDRYFTEVEGIKKGSENYRQKRGVGSKEG